MEAYRILLTRRSAPDAVPQVFLASGEEGRRLPSFFPDQEIYHTDAYTANQLVRSQLKAQVVRRQALRLPDSTLGRPLNIYIMELYDAAQVLSLTQPGNWLGRKELSAESFASPVERAVISTYLAEAHGEEVPSLGISWWQEDWFTATSLWLRTQVVELGYEIFAPVEQVRSAYTSAILRVLTDKGYLYLKVVPKAFAHEITLTRQLAQRDSAHFPLVPAAAHDRMILQDLGDHTPPGIDTSLTRWEQIVRYYAELQVTSVPSIPMWLASGCADLRTDRLAARVPELIAQIPERLQGLPQQLSVEERGRLHTLTDLLSAQCEELIGYGIPDTLEHGDLHVGNIALSESGFRLYDWSHACATHPFYGFGSLFLDDNWFPEQPGLLLRLRDVYLEAWSSYHSRSHLQEAFTLWQRLRPLFLAAHQSYVVTTYQSMLGGHVYIPESATGNACRQMQWWLANHWRNLLRSYEAEG